jgi:hypothetical protein
MGECASSSMLPQSAMHALSPRPGGPATLHYPTLSEVPRDQLSGGKTDAYLADWAILSPLSLAPLLSASTTPAQRCRPHPLLSCPRTPFTKAKELHCAV